jgi:aminoglycoside phosphotransferase (APT) family kinase protein
MWEHNTGYMDSPVENVYATLKRCCPSSKKRLTHGDVNFENIIFDKKTNKIKALVDWEMSCLGDPLSDIGNFFLIFLKPRSLVPINAEPALRGKLNESLTEMEKGPSNKMLLVATDSIKHKKIPSEKRLLSQYKESFPGVGNNLERRVCFAKAVSCLRWISILKSAKRDDFKGHESRLYPLLKKHPDVAVEVLLKAARTFTKKCL